MLCPAEERSSWGNKEIQFNTIWLAGIGSNLQQFIADIFKSGTILGEKGFLVKKQKQKTTSIPCVQHSLRSDYMETFQSTFDLYHEAIL